MNFNDIVSMMEANDDWHCIKDTHFELALTLDRGFPNPRFEDEENQNLPQHDANNVVVCLIIVETGVVIYQIYRIHEGNQFNIFGEFSSDYIEGEQNAVQLLRELLNLNYVMPTYISPFITGRQLQLNEVVIYDDVICIKRKTHLHVIDTRNEEYYLFPDYVVTYDNVCYTGTKCRLLVGRDVHVDMYYDLNNVVYLLCCLGYNIDWQ
jgi:hypothetical protein